ncbi:MAG: M1 family aminopeptidase [Bdellovibrionales bacterium]
MLRNFVFLFFLAPLLSWAGVVETDIHVRQLDPSASPSLHFKVQIHNLSSEFLKFELTEKAQNLKGPTKRNQKSLKRAFQFHVEPGKKLQLEYDLEYDKNRPVFVTSQDRWIPVLAETSSGLQIFRLKSELASGFELISSATGHPQEDLALSFGPFTKVSSPDGRLHVYLMKPDARLAETLLGKLSEYLKRYESDFGPYPFQDFSVVESPDEIGYAFPQMTWIGSQLLRFPFILTTSLPHELLHQWWGTSVYVDYEKGNWCEGLTSFGADYALLDENGKKIYRLKALTNYANYVKSGQDLSLAQFVSRGEDRSLQAIGYDKALMVFVMLEQQVGESTFKKALQTFYKNYRFKKASWDDLFATLEKVSGRDLQNFKKFWIHSTGSLKSNFVTSSSATNPQSQIVKWTAVAQELTKIPGHPVQTELYFLEGDAPKTISLQVDPKGRELIESLFSFPSDKKPRAYGVDPKFFLFRELQEIEKPVTFSQLFGASNVSVKSPAADLSESLRQVFPDINLQEVIRWDSSRPELYLMTLEQAKSQPEIVRLLEARNIKLSDSSLRLDGTVYDLSQTAVFFSLRWNRSKVIVISINDQLSTLRWVQRWSRYGAQSYVVLNRTSASPQGLWLDRFEQSY